MPVAAEGAVEHADAWKIRERVMREIQIPIPEIGLIAGTRAALGMGIGLLLADQMTREQRRAAGLALLAVGVVTTFPLIVDVWGRRRSAREQHSEHREPQVAGTYGV
jgi:hypothetical protein